MTHAALRSRLSGADHEERLARAAASGNARAFATLFARYAERVFGLAFRLTGSAELAAEATRGAFADALDAMSHIDGSGARFGSCALIAARNRSIELLPAEGEPDAEREHADADEAEQHATRHAVLGLEGAQREVLALGALEGLPRGGIATVMDVESDSVAELSAEARVALHDELWGPDPEAETRSEECAQAMPLMAMRDDGCLEDEEDRAWLVGHLAHCRECRLRLDAMEQGQAAYDRWRAPAPPEGLLAETMAAAARFTDDDARASRRAAIGPVLATAGGAATSTLSSAKTGASRIGSSVWGARRWSDRFVTAALVLVMLLGLSATLAGATLVLRGSDGSEPPQPQTEEADAPTTTEAPQPVAPATNERAGRVRAASRRKKARPEPRRGKLVVVRPPAQPKIEKPKPKRERPREAPRAEAVPVPTSTPTPTTPKPAPTPPPVETTPQETPQLQPAPAPTPPPQ